MKNKKLFILFFLVPLVILILVALFVYFFYFFPSYENSKETPVETKEISLSEFKSLYDSNSGGGPGEFIILDLRPESEWEEGHILYSVHFSPENLDKFNNIQKIDRFKKVVVVASGASEVKDFINQLKKKDWKKPKEFYGLETSVDDWFEAGYPEDFLELEI